MTAPRTGAPSTGGNGTPLDTEGEPEGGNGTLAWEPSPGVVAYVGWSGAETTAKAVTALRTLAEGTYILTPSQWLATKPELNEQENNPAN